MMNDVNLKVFCLNFGVHISIYMAIQLIPIYLVDV